MSATDEPTAKIMKSAEELYMITCVIASITFLAMMLHLLFLRKHDKKVQKQWKEMLAKIEGINRQKINVTEINYRRYNQPKSIQKLKYPKFYFPRYDCPQRPRPVEEILNRQTNTQLTCKNEAKRPSCTFNKTNLQLEDYTYMATV